MSSSRDWESNFRTWAEPLSSGEDERCENAVRMVGKAIAQSQLLNGLTLEVFVHGSYRNNTGVRLDSDIDVCIRNMDLIFPDFSFVPGTSNAEAGLTAPPFAYGALKNNIGVALGDYFGTQGLVRGNKVFALRENSYRVSADVAPTCERRRYYRNSYGSLWYESGTILLPDNGGSIENWPHQHYDNGVAKNTRTSRRFKAVVRILKRLRNAMAESGAYGAEMPSYLVECLVWNVPDGLFGSLYLADDVQAVIHFLVAGTSNSTNSSTWVEVNGRKYLFHSTQKWSLAQAHSFLIAASHYLGIQS